MLTRNRVDPELLPFVDLIEGEWSTETLATQRARTDQMRQVADAIALPDGVIVEERTIPGPAGAAPIQLLVVGPTIGDSMRPAVLHIHGGGYVSGSAQTYRPHVAKLSLQLGAVVVSVNYRLASETVFPGAIEDCYAALMWLKVEAGELKLDPTRIAVAGESAGGRLPAALAILARDRKEVALVAQMLAFPMLDDRTVATVDVGPHAGRFVWTDASNRFGWASLLGHPLGEGAVSAYAAAARCTDLTSLPPAFIAVGDLDLFLEENLEYARRLA
jgi:acetyl esterase/lipase